MIGLYELAEPVFHASFTYQKTVDLFVQMIHPVIKLVLQAKRFGVAFYRP